MTLQSKVGKRKVNFNVAKRAYFIKCFSHKVVLIAHRLEEQESKRKVKESAAYEPEVSCFVFLLKNRVK